MRKNYYAVLGLARGCRDESEIKKGASRTGAGYCGKDGGSLCFQCLLWQCGMSNGIHLDRGTFDVDARNLHFRSPQPTTPWR